MIITFVKILAVGLITTVAYILVKQTRPEIAMIISIAGSVLLITMTVSALGDVFSSFYNIFTATGVEFELLAPLLKSIAIGYVAEFGANICQGAGASSVADKILFSAKIIILLISLPIINSVIDAVVNLL
ncbi:MAG: hypothetical protein MJ152_03990 [Clostridia bacterium]|nr:hypothetical protein [Clostridia bacterium]